MTDLSKEFEDLKFNELTESDMRERAQSFLDRMSMRRTVRSFSNRPVSKEIIQQALALSLIHI